MKLNTAFNILLAVICTVSRAHARVPSRLRDPRTVEEKEQVHRQTMGDYVTVSLLNMAACDGNGNCLTCQDRLEAKEAELKNDADLSPEQAESLACTAVSEEFEVCQGYQGFSQVVRYHISLPCIHVNIFLLSYALTFDMRCMSYFNLVYCRIGKSISQDVLG